MPLSPSPPILYLSRVSSKYLHIMNGWGCELLRTSGFLCGAMIISQRAFWLNSHSNPKSCDGVSIRCRANEQITMSSNGPVGVSISSPLCSSPESWTLSSVWLSSEEKIEGICPLATSWKDNVAHLHLIRCSYAGAVNYQGEKSRLKQYKGPEYTYRIRGTNHYIEVWCLKSGWRLLPRHFPLDRTGNRLDIWSRRSTQSLV
jgi:hypothetical protein